MARRSNAPSEDWLREIVLDSNRDLPLHAQLRTALERLILEHFADKDRFYSENQLINALRISQGTIRRALADLAVLGLLEKKQARCTYVRRGNAVNVFANLAVFLPDYSSPTISIVLSILNEECLNRGIHLQPIYTHRGDRLLRAYDSLKFSPGEGGVVLLENSPRATTELSAALRDKGYDHVVFGTGSKRETYKHVGGSNAAMIRIGMQHLVDLGHRRIYLIVNEPEEKETVTERIQAFSEFSKSSPHHLETQTISPGTHLWDDPYKAAIEATKIAMSEKLSPTAIFALSDPGAFGAMAWLQEHGYRVPKDISVIGIGGLPLGEMVHPALTTLADPYEEMVQAIFRLFSEKNPENRRILFEPTLLKRKSSAPPPVEGSHESKLAHAISL